MRIKVWIIALGVLAAVTSASAWEVSTSGTFQTQYRYISRVGQDDLFGNVSVAQRTGTDVETSIGLSGPWNLTVVPEAFTSKGSDASWMLQTLRLDLDVKLNPAVALRAVTAVQTNPNGLYQGGANWTGPPHYNGYFRPDVRGEDINAAVSSAVVRALWASVDTPIGRLKIGRVPYGFGPGWSGLHSDDTALSGVFIAVPWGPFSFVAGNGFGYTGAATDAYDTRNQNRTVRAVSSGSDKNESRAFDVLAGFTYRNGPLDLGVLNRFVQYRRVHSLPQPGGTLRDDMSGSFAGQFFNAYRLRSNQDDPLIPVYGDVYLNTFVGYLKYFNGRLFFNAEYDQQYVQARRDGGRPISGFPKGWLVESGASFGPVRLTSVVVYRQGHDRTGGLLDVSAPSGSFGTVQAGDTWSQYIMLSGGAACLEPYQFLIGLYGAGNNGYDSTGKPNYADFLAYGGRLDYAAAANLNVWVTALNAKRASNTGSWWGQYTGGISPSPARGANVADTNLGYEVGGGVSWQLLDGLTYEVGVYYWRPGAWFKHAYVDYSTRNTTPDPSSGQDTRINPDRGLSGIFAVKTGATLAF